MISVIVPVYNVERYIEKCLRSILNQTYKDLEIILVDDGSTDSSGLICDNYAKIDNRIIVIHKENDGAYVARNCGIEMSKGEYIAFVDSDDWIDSTMYEVMINALESSKVDIAICRMRRIYKRKFFTENFTEKITILNRNQVLKAYISGHGSFKIYNSIFNQLYRKELIEQLRFPKNKYYQDLVYTTKLLSRINKAAFIDQPYYNYVVDRKGGITNLGVGERTFTDLIPAYERKARYLKKIGEHRLAYLHEINVLKSLRNIYTVFYFSQLPNKNESCKKVIRFMRKKYRQLKRAEFARNMNKTEKYSMLFFLQTPRIFCAYWYLNENVWSTFKKKLKVYFL